MTPRSPYEDTSVPVGRSQERIRELLRRFGARQLAFAEELGDNGDRTMLAVRFLYLTEAGVSTFVRITFHPLPEEHEGKWKDANQRERQAWRGLVHYLEGTLKATEFGLMRFEELVLAWIETPDGRTVAEHLVPMLDEGRLAIEAPK
jgi:hypothetical protein